jgi:two-component system chemotaxis sensor kinase CheA
MSYNIPEEMKVFLVECYELLDQSEQDLLALEKNGQDLKLINQVFRCIHTIKGNSGFLGLNTLESLCHKGEGLLDHLRSDRLQITPEISSLLLNLFDIVRAILTSLESSGRDDSLDISLISSQIEKISSSVKKQ